MYEALGGEARLVALTAAFYVLVSADSLLRAAHITVPE
jgi:truncated hemoglobin YjbI